MNDGVILRRIPVPAEPSDEMLRSLHQREWLVTNGIGGYASGTLSGVRTRRYHGLLVAAMAAPFGRTMMLNHLTEQLDFADGRVVHLGADEGDFGQSGAQAKNHLREFRLEMGLPVWRYEIGETVLERQVFLPHGQNTVYVHYRLLSGPDVHLTLRPSMHFRRHGAETNVPFERPYVLSVVGDRYEISAGEDFPVLRLQLDGQGAALLLDGGTKREVFHRLEAELGYESRGTLWNPGHFLFRLTRERSAWLVASTEDWHTLSALRPAEALSYECTRRKRLVSASPAKLRDSPIPELVLAANQFIFTPEGRVEAATRAGAAGDELRAIIAGYHWFTDWGRDTMISLEGLTLCPGRHREAGWILRTAAQYIREGLIPNLIREGEAQGLYNTADASLWYFHALDRYLEYTNDRATLRLLLPKLREIIDSHLRGTLFNIGVDPKDGLLNQGKEDFALTWMDAKVEDWVVTPRRGKAVEINALWYNALRLLEGWLRQEEGDEAANPIAGHAERAYRSFNKRFWNAQADFLYDIVDGEDGDDGSLRPNQLFAISLRHPVLSESRWVAVLEVVRKKLLTPVGLRTLDPAHPDYKAVYFGDLRARDAAYHQGTVWPWLIGPFIDAWMKTYPDRKAEARTFLDGFLPQLDQGCIGSLSEIHDAEPPFVPRGCISQAWSVAEVVRCWVKTAP